MNQTITIESPSPIAKVVVDFVQYGEVEPKDFLVDNIVLTTPVPEPSGLVLLLVAAAIARRRRAPSSG